MIVTSSLIIHLLLSLVWNMCFTYCSRCRMNDTPLVCVADNVFLRNGSSSHLFTVIQNIELKDKKLHVTCNGVEELVF